MKKKTIGSAAFVVLVMALAASLVLLNRADRQKTGILVGVPTQAGADSLAADFTLSKPLKNSLDQNTVTFALLNAGACEQDPDGLGQADAVIRMDAPGRPDAPFQFGALVWLEEDCVLVRMDGQESVLRRVDGPDGQALAELVREQIAPYQQPRNGG